MPTWSARNISQKPSRTQSKEDDFNKVYGQFSSAKERAGACVKVLKEQTPEFKSKVLESMLKVAAASKEDDNENNVSPEEMDFIQQVREALE